MQRPFFNRRTVFLWVDLILVVISLCCTVHMRKEMADGLSFGGFFVLFILLILDLYFGALIGSLFLLPLTIRSGKVRFAVISAVLQTLGSIPWLWLIRLFEYPFSWYEILVISGITVRLATLLSLLIAKLVGKAPH